MASTLELEPQTVGYYKYYPKFKLGEGNFATVYLARHRVSKCDVALKIINIDDIEEDYVLRNLEREEKIMGILHHPNIIHLYEVVKEKNLHCLSLERVRGVNLHQYLKNQPSHKIPEKLARLFFYQMLSAVDYMHNLNIIHRDLKLENILLECGHIIKIADFGLSNVYYPCIELRTHCGSVEYAAPELFKSSAYGTAADIWSLGVILYVMVIGKMPFAFYQKKRNCAFNTLMREFFAHRISKGLIQDNWKLMEHLSPDCWNLLHDLLQPDQFNRIRIKNALAHPWIIKDKYLARLLPQERRYLQKRFHPEIIEYIACKLKMSESHIERHLNVYQNDIIAAMYFMMRDVLVKDVLHPLKEVENSFLYQFECWRKNLNSQHPIQKYEHGHLGKKKSKEKITESLVLSQNVSADDKDYKVQSQKSIDNLKLQSLSEVKDHEPSIKHSVEKDCHPASEVVDCDSKNVQEQMKSVPYRSYKNSRPEKVKSCQNTSLEIVKNKESIGEVAKTSTSSAWNKEKRNSSIKELAKDRMNENKMNRESDNQRRVSARCYREYSSRVFPAERNKMKYTTCTKTKGLIDKSDGKDTRNIYPAKIQTKTSLSANEMPRIKNSSTFTKNVAVLKRAERNVDAREIAPKTTDEDDVAQQTPTQQPKNNFKCIGELPKSVYAQTPSRIPVKIMRYGPPAPFSQPAMVYTKKPTQPSEPSEIQFCRGDRWKM